MIGLIGGTGLGDALVGQSAAREVFPDTPFGKPSGPIRLAEWSGVQLAIVARHGDGHMYNPSQVPYRANIYALKSLGVTHILASGACGSLREEIAPRDLVVVDQVIDRTYRRTPTFFDEGLAVHVEFADPYCPQLRGRLLAAASKTNATVHPRGTYVCMEGPAFSTVAESRLHCAWGADLIGMTAMPEARLAREAEMCYATVALATDYDCWRPHTPGVSRQALLEEILGHLKAATENAIALLRATIATFAERPADSCACHQALELGIWSDRSKVAPYVARRYGKLLEKYIAGVERA
ncbi:MAG: S-methyl-5'-thioadenosine phosphorylase [Phycisphaerae bacterium]